MKEIRFAGRQYDATQRVLNGIKWATYRKGTRKWESDNVPVTIHRYLIDNGADSVIYNVQRIKWVMRRLRDDEYADIVLNGRRFTKLIFHPDVDLQGWIPEFVKEKMERGQEPELTFDTSITFDTDEDSDLPIPIPTPPKPERYKAKELNDLLDRFADKEPEVYGIYAEKLERGLLALLERETE